MIKSLKTLGTIIRKSFAIQSKYLILIQTKYSSEIRKIFIIIFAYSFISLYISYISVIFQTHIEKKIEIVKTEVVFIIFKLLIIFQNGKEISNSHALAHMRHVFALLKKNHIVNMLLIEEIAFTYRQHAKCKNDHSHKCYLYFMTSRIKLYNVS